MLASETGMVSETQSPDEETGLLEALNGARKLLTKETVSGVGLTNRSTYRSQIRIARDTRRQ